MLTLGVLLFVIGASVPEPIRAFLRSNPEYHLLGLRDVGEIGFPLREDQLSSFAEGDASGDGRGDIVAAVARILEGRSVPSVIAFNGDRLGYGPPLWVLKDHEHVVTGVEINERNHKVIVWECFECDSSPWFRWDGHRYEEGLWARGDSLEVAPDASARVLDRPDPGGALVGEVPSGTEVSVLAAGPKIEPKGRWYKVRARLGPKVIQGWVDARALWENYPRDQDWLALAKT